MDGWVTIVLGLLALGGPLSVYLVQIRKTSGRVATASDAADLWAEAGNIRKEYAERIRVLEERDRWQEERYMRLLQEHMEMQRRVAGGAGA